MLDAYDPPVQHQHHTIHHPQSRSPLYAPGTPVAGMQPLVTAQGGPSHAGHATVNLYAPQQHPQAPMLMDPSPMAMPHRQSMPHFGAGGAVVSPVWQTPPTQAEPAHAQPHYGTGAKRLRPDDFDAPSAAGLHDLGQPDLDSMPKPVMEQAYAHASAVDVRHDRPHPTHHHHHLPDSGSPYMAYRESGGGTAEPGGSGAPSVVGQEGMPAPAPRPRGPKLKFTADDDELLIDLKEHRNLTWKQIADFFPGRSSGTLQVHYCTKLKAKATEWTDEMVSAVSLESFGSLWFLLSASESFGGASLPASHPYNPCPSPYFSAWVFPPMSPRSV